MQLTRRESLALAAAALAVPGSSVAATQAMSPIATLDPALLDGILEAGGWSDTADDNGGGERLPEDFAAAIITAGRTSAPSAELGALVLTLSVAEWGLAWKGTPPSDPAKQRWQGPSSIRQGKHLMSYALGGIGLPHLDTGGAVDFFDMLAQRLPDAKEALQRLSGMPGGFRYDTVRAEGGICAPIPKDAVSMTDLDGAAFEHDAATFGGTNYCNRFNPRRRNNPEAWRELRHWCRVGLRRRDVQEWVIKDWINTVWLPAYNEVMGRPHGTLKEAFVVARIWNTSRGAALKALRAAGAETDPEKRIAAELARYADGNSTHRARLGLMQRPGVVYDTLGGT